MVYRILNSRSTYSYIVALVDREELEVFDLKEAGLID
jgi:hypothetical protein